MEALHFAVRKLPTIGESTTEILRAIEGFESVVHWHGTDGHFLQSLGNKKPVIDLGKVFHRFLLPVRKCIKTSKALCKIDQAVACVLLEGKWISPHLSLNDALMLQESFKGFAKLLA
jgi:hypothetical protein